MNAWELLRPVTRRAWRLRIFSGVSCLLFVLLSLYGARALMPRLNQTAAHISHSDLQSRPAPQALPPRARRVLGLTLATAYAYWTVTFLIGGATLVSAWLEVREIARFQAEARSALWQDAAAALIDAAGVDQKRAGE